MAQINIAFDETNPDVNPETCKDKKEWLTYRWGYSDNKDIPRPKEWYKSWHKKEEPTFTERDMKGDPLSQYRGEYMGMPIKDYLLMSIQEDMDMILFQKQVFMKEFNVRYNDLMKEADFVNRTKDNNVANDIETMSWQKTLNKIKKL